MSYKPLPDYVTIRVSEIDGLGLFCVLPIQSGQSLGISHIHDTRFPNRYIRTPLGGFINHSDEPNCKTVDIDTYKYLTTTQDINPGEELTLKYTMYNLDVNY